jgi:hypothetical protein
MADDSNSKPVTQTAMPWGRELNIDDLPMADRQAARILMRMLEANPPNPVEYLKQHGFKIVHSWEK